MIRPPRAARGKLHRRKARSLKTKRSKALQRGARAFLFSSQVWHYRGVVVSPECQAERNVFGLSAATPCLMRELLGNATQAAKWPPAAPAKVQASEVIRSWNILPQLANVVVDLTGIKQAAKSLSEITIQFTPVSDATSVVIKAKKPYGFKLNAAALPASVNPEGILLDPQAPPQGVQITILVKITAGVPIKLVISSVQMVGGRGFRSKCSSRRESEREFVLVHVVNTGHQDGRLHGGGSSHFQKWVLLTRR